MRGLTLRSRLLLWASSASAVPLILVIILVDLTFRANIRDQLQDGLVLARQVAESARAAQMDTHIYEASTLALDVRLRAAVSTGDPATVSQTLSELATVAPGGWAAVVTPEGSVLAHTGEAPQPELQGADDLVNEALYVDTGDLWVVDGALVEVAASAILFGASPLAVLVTGQNVDSQTATALEAAVGRPVAIVFGGLVVLGDEASRLDGEGRRALGTWPDAAGDAVELVDLGGERFFAAALPLLSIDGERRAVVVPLASYDQALGPSNALRVALIGILVLGLLIAISVSGFLSTAITVPVGRLLRETERLGKGDLEHPIVPLRDDEIGRLAESFEEMRVSLSVARDELIRAERLSAIGKAASAVAHDFTQPLSTIAGAIGLLRLDDGTADTGDHCFEAIEEELDRLQRMKQEIVEFARGESQLDAADVRVDSFLENTVSALRPQLAQRDVRLSIDHGFEGEWYLDSYRLERVMENLIRNAAAAIPGAGKIDIRSALSADGLVIEVEDDGAGIPADRIDEIFEPFVSFGKKEGTGLGLAIARNVVQQHGGSIDVASRPGCTRFKLTLPRRTGSAAPARGSAPTEPAAAGR